MERWSGWGSLCRCERAVEWLRIWADLGKSPHTIAAYGRGLDRFLGFCEAAGLDPLEVKRGDVASYVRELMVKPHHGGANVLVLDSGAGLSNATLQQRLVPVRLFYDFLVEEGVRESNPVGRGRYAAGRGGQGAARGLVPRVEKLPWIPGEADWLRFLQVVRVEPPRNRLMLALAYDVRCAGRSCARCAPMTWTRRTGCCGCARRLRRTGVNGLCRTRRPLGSCSAVICGTVPRSAGSVGRCSFRNPGATWPSR